MPKLDVRPWSLFAALAFAVAGCGDRSTTKAVETNPSATSAPTTTKPTATTGPTAATPPGENPEQPEDPKPPEDPEPPEPGEPIELGPRGGEIVAVVGVAHDDVLNARAAPGIDQEIVFTLDPTAADVEARGQARQLPSSVWYEISRGGSIGWVNSQFIAHLGGVEDATSEVVAAEGEIPSAASLEQMATLVAGVFASSEPETASKIVIVVGPSTGDLGEIGVDIVGLGDDSILGYRLQIFAQRQGDNEAWSLKAVERTLLCDRGVSGGLCL